MCVTVTLLPQKSVASEVYTAFPQISNSETTNHNKRHLMPLIKTGHYCTVILGFLKIFTFRGEAINHFRTIILSQSPRF